jgi:hypothetical protein
MDFTPSKNKDDSLTSNTYSPNFPNNPNNNFLNLVQGESARKDLLLYLQSEIRNLENSLSIYNFPSYREIFNTLLELEKFSILKQLMFNLTEFLKNKSNEQNIKTELIDKVNRLDSEKRTLLDKLDRQETSHKAEVEQMKRLILKKEEDLKKHKEDIVNVKNDLIQERILKDKHRSRVVQLEHEISRVKKESDEKSAEMNEKFFGKSSQAKNDLLKYSKGINMSYTLGDSSGNNYSKNYYQGNFINFNTNLFPSNNSFNTNYQINSQNINNDNEAKKEFFNQIETNFDNKYRSVLVDNEKLKDVILSLNSRIINIVNYKKEAFLSYYKRTFGEDFPNDDNLPLDADSLNLTIENLNHSVDIGHIVKVFDNNFNRLEEFLKKSEEIRQINKDFNHGKTGAFNKDNFLYDKYLVNTTEIFTLYKKVNDTLFNLVETHIRFKTTNPNSIEEMISRFDKSEFGFVNREEHCKILKEMIKDIKENSDILKDLDDSTIFEYTSNKFNKEEMTKIKESEEINVENLRKFNASLYDEVSGYEKILNSCFDYCSK